MSKEPYPDIINSRDLRKLRGVSFGSINIRSVQYKLDEVMTFLMRSDLDYFSMTETLLNSSTKSTTLFIPGYQYYCLDHVDSFTAVGGGILVYC